MKNSGIFPKCNEILEKTDFILGYDMKTYLEEEEKTDADRSIRKLWQSPGGESSDLVYIGGGNQK